MTQATGGFIGMALGIVLVIGIQVVCYHLFDEEHYPKATVVAFLAVILGVMAIILLVPVTE